MHCYSRYIPEKDKQAEIDAFKGVFSYCEDYVKIQDSYIAEQIFDFIDLTPANISI